MAATAPPLGLARAKKRRTRSFAHQIERRVQESSLARSSIATKQRTIPEEDGGGATS